MIDLASVGAIKAAVSPSAIGKPSTSRFSPRDREAGYRLLVPSSVIVEPCGAGMVERSPGSNGGTISMAGERQWLTFAQDHVLDVGRVGGSMPPAAPPRRRAE